MNNEFRLPTDEEYKELIELSKKTCPEYWEENFDPLHHIGQEIADIFMLKTDKVNGHPDRYHTSWGSKTPYGLFNTLMEIADRIENGKGL